ncbi:MAG: hypothetical protein ACYTFK_12845 [Planctomycetota bacterium]|jgi:hypothetical protein
MKPNTVNINTVSGMISRSPFKKPKVMMATVLICIMCFMWIKVFVSKRNKNSEARAAVARAAAENGGAGEKAQQLKILLHPLPVVPGRNDVLTHDIFTAGRWDAFPSENKAVTANPLRKANINNADHINKIAESITLEAVIAGVNPEAFIGGKLVSVGNKLPVGYNGRIYEFVVNEIYENKVVLKWNDFTVDVEMSQLNEMK